jgi:tetratricopeptide (TPR) repeat protein
LLLGRGEEALALFPQVSSEADTLGATPLLAGGKAACLAYLGHRSDARALLRRVIIEYGIASQSDETPASLLFALLDAAVLTEDSDNALLLGRLLFDLPPLAIYSLFIPASSSRVLAASLTLLGRPDDARDQYRLAIDICGTVGHRPELAVSRFQLAELLLERYPLEHLEAIQHLDFAIREFRDMKMQPSLERALRHKEVLKA